MDLTPVSESAYNSETGDFSIAVLKYINDILMEEDLEDKPCMLQDSLALQIAEKSLYDVLGKKYSPFSDQNSENPDENYTPSSSVNSNNLIDFNSDFSDQAEFNSFVSQPPHLYSANFWQISEVYAANFAINPSKPAEVGAQNEENDRRGRKNYQYEKNGSIEEGRNKKQSLISAGVSEQLEIFDNSFLHKIEKNERIPCPLYDASKNEESKKWQHNEQLQSYDSREKRKVNKKVVDLSISLMHCAQAVGNGDRKTAYDQLKIIRLNSSPFGDGNQRSAHYFASALEARLSGTGNFFLAEILNSGPSMNAADILKSYQLYVSVCPFRKMTNFYTNRTIARIADKATRLHIIDFGIAYGFQWPCFLYRLSTRPGGPPKIRITGVDFPQPGFRPAERVEETGRRLKTLADKLNVPFEYNAIAQKWETIRYEDFKIDNGEVVVVCCMNRLKNLQDDTIFLSSPRDAVLKLIKKINPNIFVHGVVNGSFNAPFFTSRFREAFFHYSSLFDMFEATVTQEDKERLVFEREIIGKDVMNVIACEGIERYERPETYKQWQIRNSRIGFKQLPLNQDLMKRVRNIKSNYHKDFVIGEDGNWMLLGWRGRVFHAISAWKVVQD